MAIPLIVILARRWAIKEPRVPFPYPLLYTNYSPSMLDCAGDSSDDNPEDTFTGNRSRSSVVDDLGRVVSHWYDDGNVVLQAEDTVFRVYQGLLASRSPVFRTILETRYPLIGETYDGVRLVRVSDKALGLCYFLKTIDGHGALYTFEASNPFVAQSAILRLGAEYNVPTIRYRAISHPLKSFPLELKHRTKRDPPKLGSELEILAMISNAKVAYLKPSAVYECAIYVAPEEI